MHDLEFSFEINARKEDVWSVLWGRKTGDVMEIGNRRVETLHGGDQNGEGTIRHSTFPVPWYLFSRRKAQSWEWLTQVEKYNSWRYEGVVKPLWSKSTGSMRLESLENNRTRIHFQETYHVFNPITRFFLEKKVHKFISKDNRRKTRIAIEHGLRTGAHKLEEKASHTVVTPL
jgi:hypothetical protein